MGEPVTVSEFMTEVAHAVGDDQNLTEATLRMNELGVRHLPVMRGARLVGILSQRDVAALKATASAHLSELSVADAMTPDPYTVRPSDALADVARTMADRRYGAAIVVDDDKAVGIFTATDGLRALAKLTS